MTVEEIKNECQDMQAELECMIPDEVNSVIEYAKRVAVMHARSGYLLAEAKKMSRSEKAGKIIDLIIKMAKECYLSATTQKALVESIANDEMNLVDWLDRINSMCVHQIDLMRSIISKEKEELRIIKTGY